MSSPAFSYYRGRSRYYRYPKDNPEVDGPSVTTILGQLAKPALTYWAAREVAEFAHDELDTWQNLPRDAAVDLLKRAPYRNMTGKGSRGTAVHEAIEAWINQGDAFQVDDLDLIPFIAGANQYVNDHVDTIHHAEASIFNTKYQYAGTADLIATLKTGETAVIDWKTSKAIYPESALQLVAYANGDFLVDTTETRHTMPEITAAHVVHLPGTATYNAHPVNLTDRAFRTFTALRTVQKWKDDHEQDAYDKTIKGKQEGK